jgi:hypothetical protein
MKRGRRHGGRLARRSSPVRAVVAESRRHPRLTRGPRVAGGHPAQRTGARPGRGGACEAEAGHFRRALRAGLDDRFRPCAGPVAAGRRPAVDAQRGGQHRLRRQRAVAQRAHRRSRARHRLYLPGTRSPPDQAPRRCFRAGHIRRALYGVAGADRGRGVGGLRQPGGRGPRASAGRGDRGRDSRRPAGPAGPGLAPSARAGRRRRRPGGAAAAPQVRRGAGDRGGRCAPAARRPAPASARLGHGRGPERPELGGRRRVSRPVHPGRGVALPASRPAAGVVGGTGGRQPRLHARRGGYRRGGAHSGHGRGQTARRAGGGRGHDLPADQPVAPGPGRMDLLPRPAISASKARRCGNASGFTSGAWSRRSGW